MVACALAISVPAQSLPALAQPLREPSSEGGRAVTAEAGLERVVRDAGGFDRASASMPAGAARVAPPPVPAPAAVKPSANPWAEHARRATSAGQGALAQVLERLAEGPRAVRAHRASAARGELLAAAKGGAWLWAAEAFVPDAADASASDCWKLLEALTRGDSAAAEWARLRGPDAWAAPRRAALAAAMPELGRLWGFSDADQARAALARAGVAGAREPEEPASDAATAPGTAAAELAAGAAPGGPAAPPPPPSLPRAALDKLGERADLAGTGRMDEIAALQRVLAANADLARSSGRGSAGGLASTEFRWASLDALRRALLKRPDDPLSSQDARPALAGTPKEKEIEALVARMEAASSEAQQHLAARDAAAGMLASADRARGSALRERRDGKDMMGLHKNVARLAIVMDLSYTMNLLNSALKAVGGMQKLIDNKLEAIQAQRQYSKDHADEARRKRQQEEEWRKSTKDKVEQDDKNAGVFSKTARLTSDAVTAIQQFLELVPPLVPDIDRRDRAGDMGMNPRPSPTAAAEYRRKLALIPSLRQPKPDNGDDSDPTKLSPKKLQADDAKVRDALQKLQDSAQKLDTAPKEFAPVLIALAPPDDKQRTLVNPSIDSVRQILSERRDYFKKQQADFRKLLGSLQGLLSPSGGGTRVDDLGDTVPESLVVYKQRFQERARQGREIVAQRAPKIDQAAAKMAAAGGPSLEPLTGRSVDDLIAIIPRYADTLQNMSLSLNGDAGFDVTFQKLIIVENLFPLADGVILWAEGDKAIPVIDEVLGWLPKVRDALALADGAMDKVLQDIALDEAVLPTLPWSSDEAQAKGDALYQRKKALLFGTLKPMLERLAAAIEELLLPYANKQAQTGGAQSSRADDYQKLYENKLSLVEKIGDTVDKRVPWGLAGWGAREGDVAAARANIAARHKEFEGYRSQVADYRSQIKRRTDPDNTETEQLYGETMPYSLPRRIKQYQDEMARRAAQINAADAEVNGILKDIDQATGGKYQLAARYALPVGLVTGAPDTSARLHDLLQGKPRSRLEELADIVKQIGEDAQKRGGDGGPSLGGGDIGEIPTGKQPSPKISDDQRLALLALDAVKRLVPTTATTGGGSVAEAGARYLFAEAVADGSQKALREQVPAFGPFLDRAAPAIERAIADLGADEAFVSAPGSGASVYTRKLAVFRELHAITEEGAGLFEKKRGWDNGDNSSIDKVKDYYDGTEKIYAKSAEALDAEEKAALTFKKTIDAKAKELLDQRKMVSDWYKQLNDPHESAMNRVAQSLEDIQKKTEQVVRMQSAYARTKREFDEANEALESRLKEVEADRRALSAALDDVRLDDLDPKLAERVRGLTLGTSGWLSQAADGSQALVVPKAGFANFLTTLFGDPTALAGQNAQLVQQLQKDPASLAALLPNARMLQVGDDPSGFYVVYQSAFGTPNGLESENNVTFGNVLRVGNTGINVGGYKFGSPPNAGNAPYGDQGATIELETLGDHGVNYMDVTFHRFLQNGPTDNTIQSQAQQTRMMVFEDFALLVAGDRLYVGGTGFGDWALSDTKDKPYYMGGNAKASIKFTEVMRLSASDAELYASDPRSFLQKINLDFTKWDPSMNQDYIISAHGDQKRFHKSQVAAEANVQQALQNLNLPQWLDWLKKDSFDVDVHFMELNGTDDISQRTLGARVVKGFSWSLGDLPMRATISGSYDNPLGTLNPGRNDTYQMMSGRIGFELPKQGLSVAVQGKQYGDKSAYVVELRKQLHTNSSVFVSYGNPYIGLNNRLMLGTETVFTLGQLWRSVVGGAAQDLMGGKALEGYRADLDRFFEREAPEGTLLGELKKVFDSDVGQRLIQLEIGRVARELETLNKAGNILENTRLRGVAGWASAPIGTTTADRAVGGGPQLGTLTDITLTKTQRGMVEKQTAELFSAGLRLQTRLLELTKDWQQAVADVLQAQWELELARWSHASNREPVLAAETEARIFGAQARLHQARVRYNLMTGRPADAETLNAVNPQDFDALLRELGVLLKDSYRVSALLGRLSPSALPVTKRSFNVLDYIPFVERLTIGIGAQLQDLIANQVIGGGVTIRLPLYDKESKTRDKSWRLESAALLQEMRAAYTEYWSRAERERLEAEGLAERIDWLRGESFDAAGALGETLRRYRNGLSRREELWRAERRWHEGITSLLDARARLTLARAWARLDDTQSRSGSSLSTAAPNRGPVKDLVGALDQATRANASLEALALRSQAAAQLAAAADHRISKAGIDLYAGVNLTVTGTGWIPGFGATGFPVLPIPWVQLRPEELQTLESRRRGKDREAADGMRLSLTADLAAQILTQLGAFRAADESLAIAENELLPQRERAAAAKDPAAVQGLAQARLQIEELRAARAQALASLNFLLGRDPAAELDIALDSDALLGQLRAMLGGGGAPIQARRRLLAARVATAQAVEEIVDRNLKVSELKVEPLSLVARSLGRLIGALSGSGEITPEQRAQARNQVLEAQRQQAAFERELPAARARLAFELAGIDAELSRLEGRKDPESRIRAAGLRQRRLGLQAQAAVLGVDARGGGSAAPPGSFAALKERLLVAAESEAASASVWDVDEPAFEGPKRYTQAFGRYFYAREALDKTPIGEHNLEGWLEFRLKSPTTRHENFLALAHLQKERGDQFHLAALSRARAEAEALLARFAARASLLRAAPRTDRRLTEALEAGLRADFGEIAAHLGLPRDARLEDLLALVPLPSDTDPLRLAEQTRKELERIDWDALQRVLFEDGVPEEFRRVQDGITRLRTDLIAEKMSYKGFTPVGAVGLFRGRAVAGAFLEAPDPREIEAGLREILDDALGHELEAQERLHALALRLHGLMAAVADGLRVLESRQAALRVARDNWMGTQVEAARGLAPARAVADAQRQADGAWTEFLDTLVSLRVSFVELATELAALGHGAPESPASAGGRGLAELPGAEPDARERLLDYWTDRMLDASFARTLDRVFDRAGVVPAAEREALAQEVARWRLKRQDAATLRVSDYSPFERLQLLSKADVAGRREAVRARLASALEAMGGWAGAGSAAAEGAGGQPVWTFLLEDLQREIERSRGALDHERTLGRAMREAFWRSAAANPAAEASYRRLSVLRVAVEERRDALLSGYLESREAPEDFLLRDKQLDAYLSAATAYDAAVVQAFQDPAASGDRLQAARLNAVFSLSASAARRKDLLAHGRALLAAGVLAEAEASRLDALRFERAAPEAIGRAAQRLAWLQAYRDRLLASPESLPSVAAELDESGGVRSWWTHADLDGFRRAGRLVASGAAVWLLPAPLAGGVAPTPEALARVGAARLAFGVDGARDRLEEARRTLRDRGGRQADALLAASEFAVVRPDGAAAPMTLAKLRELEAMGRVLYFRRRPDARGLRSLVHPVEARWIDPRELVAVLDSGSGGGPDRFPSLEALEASGEASRFSTIRVGSLGARALAAEEAELRDRSLAAGWTLLKLDAYGFAVEFSTDGKGSVAIRDAYMTEESFSKARKAAGESAEDAPDHDWKFFKASDLSLGLAKDGTVVEVRLKSGWFRSRAVFRAEGDVDRWLRGELYGAELDRRGRIVRAFEDETGLEHDARKWWFEDMEGRFWPGDGSALSPSARLKRYIDPKTRLPVVLGRSLLARNLGTAKRRAKTTKLWAYAPWNVVGMALESLLTIPMELTTGRDPNQEGALGRSRTRRVEGGMTAERTVAGKLLRFVDVTNFLPDRVEQALDPSQYPSEARAKGAVGPGRSAFEGTPKGGGQELHLGAEGWLRQVRYAEEDIEEARGRILSAFEGGVRSIFVETVRGRAGTYPDAKVEYRAGKDAMAQALRELGVRAGPDGRAEIEAEPLALAVDRVTGEIEVRLGASQHEAERRRYDAWAKELEKEAGGDGGPTFEDLRRALDEAEKDRAAARAAQAAVPKAVEAAFDTAFPVAPLIDPLLPKT